MRSLFALLLILSPMAGMAAESVNRPAKTGGGAHPLLYVLAPIVFLAELQSKLSPEKPSCWNDGASEVAGCRLVDKIQGETK